MRLKTALVIVVGLIVGVTIVLIWRERATPPTVPADHPVQSEVPNAPGADAAERVADGAGAQTATPLLAQAAWREIPETIGQPLPPLRAGTENQRLIALDRTYLRELKVGQTLEVLIPQLAREYPVTIKEAKTTARGSRVIRGNILDDRRFGFLLTLGPKTTFATIGTPAGVFNLTGSRDLAFIVPGRELTRRVESGLDYVISEPEELPEVPSP